MNLRSFKLNRVYLDLLNTPNAGDFSWSWILKDFTQVQKEEGKFVVVYISTSSIKRQIRRFHVVVVQSTSKESTKKRDERTELLAWSLNLLLFWSRRCGRRRSCFWLLNFLVRNLPWTQLLLTYWGDLEQVFYKKKSLLLAIIIFFYDFREFLSDKWNHYVTASSKTAYSRTAIGTPFAYLLLPNASLLTDCW